MAGNATDAPNGTSANDASEPTGNVPTANGDSESNQMDSEHAANNENQSDSLMNGASGVNGALVDSRRDSETLSMASSSRHSLTDAELTRSVEYKALFDEIKNNLVRAIKVQLKNSSALVRRVAVLMLDFLGKTTIDINVLFTSYVSGRGRSISRICSESTPFHLADIVVAVVIIIAGAETIVHRSVAAGATSIGAVTG